MKAFRALLMRDMKLAFRAGGGATLAAAYAEVGRFDDAIREQEAVVTSVRSSGDAAALQANQEMLERFRRGEALRR